MLKKITTEEAVGDRSTSELDALKHRDWVRGNELGIRCDTEDNTAVCLTAEDSVVVLKHARVAVVVLRPRHVCGCNWWRSSGRGWSWRRCRSSPSTRCPLSLASRPLRCWCRTYGLASSSSAKSWWEAKHEMTYDNEDMTLIEMLMSVPWKELKRSVEWATKVVKLSVEGYKTKAFGMFVVLQTKRSEVSTAERS